MTSRFTAAELRDVTAAVAARDWSREAKSYSYGFFYDASLDLVHITTNAPQSERSLMADRFGDRVQIEYGEGFYR